MWTDLQHAARLCRRNGPVTLAIVIAMTIGIAVTAGIVTMVNGVQLRPLPYRDQDRLTVLWQSDQESPRFIAAVANYLD
jgi:putative ABC transport system permease protein